MNAFRQHKIQNYNRYYSIICKIFEPDITPFEEQTKYITNEQYQALLDRLEILEKGE